MHPVEDLQRVFEDVPFRVLDRILLHVLEHSHQLRDAVETITSQMREATGGIAATGHLAPDLVVARQLLLGHPAAGHPASCTKPRLGGISTLGHHAGSLFGDPLSELVCTSVPWLIAHGCFPAAVSGRQRMFFTSAVVA